MSSFSGPRSYFRYFSSFSRTNEITMQILNLPIIIFCLLFVIANVVAITRCMISFSLCFFSGSLCLKSKRFSHHISESTNPKLCEFVEAFHSVYRCVRHGICNGVIT